MEKVIIIRYCEMHLKGKNRGYFEKLFAENILHNLKGIHCNLTKIQGRYILDDINENDIELIQEKLNYVCGLHTYSIAIKIDSELDLITQVAIDSIENKGTFKVETNRADKTFPMNSIEISSEIGGRILDKKKNLKVDVVNPESIVYIDIRENGKTFIFSKLIKGIGGLPSGCAGKGMLLISGGIDSPVAGFMLAKRGMKINAIHFHSYPYTNEQAKDKVIELSKIVSKYSCGLNLYVVKFTTIQEEIHKNCPAELMITIMRRFMMRISERLAIKTGNQCLITGESLGQVASQTIEGMASSNSVIEKLPVLRPLVGFDKNDIIEIAKKINTFNISILPYEDCCTIFLPKFPAIKPKMETIIKAEINLDIEKLVEEVIQQVEIIKL
jgi:thiamine biosynthesis protein ThiI